MGDIGAALAEEAVHEGGLAVVDVGDHRHVSKSAGIQRTARSGGIGGGWRGGGEGASEASGASVSVQWFEGGGGGGRR